MALNTVHVSSLELKSIGINKLSSQLNSVAKKLDLVDTKLKQTGKSFRDIGTGAVAAAGSVKALGVGAQKTGQGFKQLAGGYTAILAAGYAKRGLESLVKPAMDVESRLLSLGAITNTAGAELERFHQAAVSAAEISPYAVPEMIDTLTKLRLVTHGNTEAMAGLETVTKFAMASFNKITPEKSAEVFAQIARSFNMTGEQTSKAMQKLAGAARGGRLRLEELAPVMAKLGQASAISGQSFDNLLPILALTRRGYANIETAGTNLTRFMMQLRKEKVKEALWDNHRIKVIDKSTGKMRNIKTIMLQLAAAGKASGPALMNTLNSVMGGRSGLKVVASMMNTLMRVPDAAKAMAELDAAILNGGATLDARARAYLQSTEAQMQLLGQAWENLRSSLGSVLVPHLKDAARQLKDIADGIRWIVDSSDLTKFIVGGVIALGALGVAVLAIKAAWMGAAIILTQVLGLTGMLTLATAKLSITVLGITGPVWLIAAKLAVVVALAGAFALALKTAAEWLFDMQDGLDVGLWESIQASGAWIMSGFDRDAYARQQAMARNKKLAEDAINLNKVTAAEKVKQLAVEGAIEVQNRFHLANVETLEVLKKIKGLSSWTPIIVKQAPYLNMLARIESMSTSKRLDPAQRASMQMASEDLMPQAWALAQKAMSGSITAEEHIKLSAMLKDVSLIIKDVDATTKGAFGAGLIKAFMDKFVNPLQETGSKENVAASSDLRRLHRTGLERQTRIKAKALKDSYIQRDFTATTTAAGAAAPAMSEYTPGTTESPEYILARQQAEKAKTYQEQSLIDQSKARIAMEGILTKLGGTLQVEIDSDDLMGAN